MSTSTSLVSAALEEKIAAARSLVNEQIDAARAEEVCVTSSFQAEDMVVVHLVRAVMGDVPVIFLDTGYHFAETYAYRDRLAEEWGLNLVNVLPSSYRGRTGIAIRHSEPDCARPLLRHAQSRSVVCVARALPPMVHRAAPGAGKDSRKSSSGGCIHFTYGQATAEDKPAGGLVDPGRMAVRGTAWHSPAVALRKRLHQHRMRAMYQPAFRSQ